MEERDSLAERLKELEVRHRKTIVDMLMDSNEYFSGKESLAKYCLSGVGAIYVLVITGIGANVRVVQSFPYLSKVLVLVAVTSVTLTLIHLAFYLLFIAEHRRGLFMIM